jgi:carbamoyl-phosphate synthase large subunit
MNIVISGVGRRAYLVEYFRQALMGRGLVIGTNSIANATGVVAADRSQVIPPASDERFIYELIGIGVAYKARPGPMFRLPM